MAAADAAFCVYFQFAVMVVSHFVPRKGKVVIFIDKTDVKPCGTGQAMIAVDAMPERRRGGKSADNRIIGVTFRSRRKFKQLVKVGHTAHAGHDGPSR